MIHCLLPEIPSDGIVRGDAARHLGAALRVRVGETVRLLDGQGGRQDATVAEVTKHEVRLAVRGSVETLPRMVPAVTLFQCVAKASHMEWLVEKAVELGAEELVPVLSRNCVSRPVAGEVVGRWERIASAAFEQCGGAWRMRVAPVHAWTQALERARAFGGPVLTAALPPGTPPIRETLAAIAPASRYALFVGPEGDFADFELDALREAGSRFVGLGPTILRTDTAAVAALACLRLLG